MSEECAVVEETEEIIEPELREGIVSEEVAEKGPQEEVLPEELVPVLEALIFVSGEPLGVGKLSEVAKAPRDVIEEALMLIADRYAEDTSGLELVQVAGRKYQFRSRAAYAEYIKVLKAGKPRKLSHAALETLAIVAYRQPIVKSDVEKIRGVDAAPTIKTLLERKMVKIVGHQATVGQPALYGTTDEFLKIFGLTSLSELPSLRDIRELEADPGETEELAFEEVTGEQGAEDIVSENTVSENVVAEAAEESGTETDQASEVQTVTEMGEPAEALPQAV